MYPIPKSIIDHFQHLAGSFLSQVAVWVFLEAGSETELSVQNIYNEPSGSIPMKGRKEVGLGRRVCRGVMQGLQPLPNPRKGRELRKSIRIVLN